LQLAIAKFKPRAQLLTSRSADVLILQQQILQLQYTQLQGYVDWYCGYQLKCNFDTFVLFVLDLFNYSFP